MSERQPAQPKETPTLGNIEDWVGEDFVGIGCCFRLADEFAIGPYFDLNHLLSMATLRRFHNSLEKPFDKDVLSQLRDSVSLFATVGKTTAQHVPLTPQRLQNSAWTYLIGEHEHPASDIVPSLHSTGKFISQHADFLPVGDFRNDLLITHIDEEGKRITTKQRSGGRATESNVRFLVNNPEQVLIRKFDKCTHDTPWSVTILKEKDKNTYWFEFVVKSSEHYGMSRRAHSVPYIVRLNAAPQIVETFTNGLNQNLNSLGEKDIHKLLYFLTAVFYFQSDPDFPYLNPDVQPTMVDSTLPYDLLSMHLGVRENISEAPEIFTRALKETDGLKVIEFLSKSGTDAYGDPPKSLQEVISELKEAFGPEYEKLSTKIHNKFELEAKKAQEQINKTVKWRAEREKEYQKLIPKVESNLVQIFQKHFGVNLLGKGVIIPERIKGLADFDNTVLSFKYLTHNNELEMDYVVLQLRESLITNALQSTLDEVVSKIRQAGPLKKLVTKSTLGGSFVRCAENLTKEVEDKWGLEGIEKELCRRNSTWNTTTIRGLFAEFSF